MARQANFFSLLDGEEGDEDMSTLVDRLAAKVEVSARLATEEKAKEQKLKQSPQSFPAPSDYGRDGRRQGGAYFGRGPRRNRTSADELIENNQSNGYQHNQGPANGYRQDNRQSGGLRRRYNGYQRDYTGNGGYGYQGNHTGNDGYQGNYKSNKGYQGESDGHGDYQENYTEHDGYQVGDKQDEAYEGEYREIGGYRSGNGRPAYFRDNYGEDSANGNRLRQGQGYGRGRGGLGGRGSNHVQGYWRKSHVVKANEQPEYKGQDERQPMTVSEHADDKDAKDEVIKSPETKEVNANGDAVNAIRNAVNVDGNIAGFDGSSVANEASKEPKAKQKKSGLNGNIRKHWTEMTDDENKAMKLKKAEERAKEIEEDKKLLTLEQYEKIRLDKRTALLEASKTEKRAVTLDKDFALMQPIHKKEEDVTFIKLNSEKDQLKKRNSLGKDEKAGKLTNISEFFQPAGRRNAERRGGQYEHPSGGQKFERRGGQNLRYSGLEQNASVVVNFEDESQFPVLGGSAK